MKPLTSALLALAAVTVASAQNRFYTEAGVSFFDFREADFGESLAPFSVDEDSTAAPFIAAGYSFSDLFALRLSYHYINEITADAAFPFDPRVPPDPVGVPMVVYGRYEDEVHLVGLAPEFRWAISPSLKLTVSPVLNWVSSRGVVRYATSFPTFAPVPDRHHEDDGFTLGGSIGVAWSLNERWALSASYQYTDLDPSFGRQAHILSGALRWNF